MDKFDSFKKSLFYSGSGQKAEKGKNHDSFLKHVKGLVDLSRKDMAKNYSTWDYHDQVFRSRRVMDKEDRAANAAGKPSKLIVPLSFSQIMTFVAFCVRTVTQNKRFFELEFEGNAVDPVLKEPMELILERDCRKNNWYPFLVQFFLDIGRFWLGCAEVCYEEDFRNVRIPKSEDVLGAFGVTNTESSFDFQKIPVFCGNRVYPISPYRFFPDTRLPITRFQEGEFCGSEDMFSMAKLRSISDDLFNLDFIPKMTQKEYTQRRSTTRIDEMDFLPMRPAPTGGEELRENDSMVRSGAVAVTKVVLDIVPYWLELDTGEKPLGEEKFPIRYIVWYSNDRTIIRFEEAYFLHGQFPYVAAQYLPDQHKTINEGLSSVCDQITNLITWLLNQHMTSQKSTLDSKFIIDPAGIDIKTLESRSPYIFLKRNASNTGIDRYIKQFQTQDVTAGVMPDIAALNNLLEKITGLSGQMQGEYSEGRRSATQDRVVAQGAAARGQTTLASIWDGAFGNLGRQFITNNRQEMDLETFVSIVGPGPFGTENVPIEQLFLLFKGDPMSIARSEMFFVFDGTQPSEKAFLAQSLQEIFTVLVSNPTIAPLLGYGPEQIRYIFNEIYELRGVTPPVLPPAQIPPQLPPNVSQMPQPGQQQQVAAGAVPPS
jgi:hypothetical protein